MRIVDDQEIEEHALHFFSIATATSIQQIIMIKNLYYKCYKQCEL